MTENKNHPTLPIKLFAELLSHTGEDLQRSGLKDTPKRAAESWQFLTHGYHMKAAEIIKDALFDCDNNNMVIIKKIDLFSLCEHHLLPIMGECHIGYIPNGKILGLSKFARIVEMFARRLQIQEKLTDQIANTIMEITSAHGVVVVIDAIHLCMMARGVKKQNASTTTFSMLGSFKENAELKNEFLSLINAPIKGTTNE